jgi:glutaminyl-tRNA synthetase
LDLILNPVLFGFSSVGMLCGQVRKRHPWGDAKAVKVHSNYLYRLLDLFQLFFSCIEHLNILLVQEEIDKRLAEILGPKTEADSIKPVKKKKEKTAKVEVGNHVYQV